MNLKETGNQLASSELTLLGQLIRDQNLEIQQDLILMHVKVTLVSTASLSDINVKSYSGFTFVCYPNLQLTLTVVYLLSVLIVAATS